MRPEALTIHLEGADLKVTVPGANPDGREHVVTLDLDQAWPVLRRLLIARRAAQSPSDRRIGFDAALTQAQCEALLRPRMAALNAASAEERDASLALLREAGML